jgi:hypothetical protein
MPEMLGKLEAFSLTGGVHGTGADRKRKRNEISEERT